MIKASDKVTYIALGALLLFAFRPATTSSPATEKEPAAPKTITVTGSADMTIVPDKIEVNINYKEYWIRSGKKAKIEEIEDQVTKCITDAGIPKKNIVISDAFNWHHHWYYWYWWYDYNYLYNKSLTVKLRNMQDLENILKNVRDADLEKRSIVSMKLGKTTHSNIQEYRKMVKTRAVQAAKEKAGYLLAGVDNELGAVISITELDDKNDKTTTTHHYGGGPWYDPWYGYYRWGGYGGSYQTTSMNNSISNASVNASVAAPSGGGGGTGAQKEE